MPVLRYCQCDRLSTRGWEKGVDKERTRKFLRSTVYEDSQATDPLGRVPWPQNIFHTVCL